jgi:predicted ABC-type ATPase
MLERLRYLARERRDFAFETTLAGRAHAQKLLELRSSGYRSHLVFLSLPGPDLAIARVAERVRRGGHHVPNDVVRRRYYAGLRNLFDVYSEVVDRWQVYDNSDFTGPRLVASGAVGTPPVVTDRITWDALRERR